MDVNLRNCGQCARLFAPPTGGERLCEECATQNETIIARVEDAIERHGCNTLDAIVERTGIARDRVERIVRESRLLAHEVAHETPCARCGKRTAQPDSRYCLECRFELNQQLKTARLEATDSSGRQVYPLHPEVAEGDTRSVLESKRQRTGSHRFDPSPEHTKRYR